MYRLNISLNLKNEHNFLGIFFLHFNSTYISLFNPKKTKWSVVLLLRYWDNKNYALSVWWVMWPHEFTLTWSPTLPSLHLWVSFLSIEMLRRWFIPEEMSEVSCRQSGQRWVNVRSVSGKRWGKYDKLSVLWVWTMHKLILEELWTSVRSALGERRVSVRSSEKILNEINNLLFT